MQHKGFSFKPILLLLPALLLLAGIVVVWLFLRGGEPALPKDQALATAIEFLDYLKKGDVEKAWGSTNADFRSYMGKETLKNLARKNPALKETRNEPVVLERTPEKQAFEFKSTKTAKKIQVGLAWEKGTPKIETLKVE